MAFKRARGKSSLFKAFSKESDNGNIVITLIILFFLYSLTSLLIMNVRSFGNAPPKMNLRNFVDSERIKLLSLRFFNGLERITNLTLIRYNEFSYLGVFYKNSDTLDAVIN